MIVKLSLYVEIGSAKTEDLELYKNEFEDEISVFLNGTLTKAQEYKGANELRVPSLSKEQLYELVHNQYLDWDPEDTTDNLDLHVLFPIIFDGYKFITKSEVLDRMKQNLLK